ncbi:sodium channel protein para isoform X2 [Folsomia candida]|uniref:sodium channel protein para isoform X2 n=1 Tax=Folsomia candida TaxID=158441 RepID=UPI0016051328|nr:sodium channel protein para isoform X2 [Folsomia candida]
MQAKFTTFEFFRHSVTIIYALELLLKIMSEGLVRGPFSFLRNLWNYLDIVVLSTALVRPLKTVSLLLWSRLIKLIQLTPEIRRWFRFLSVAIWRLRPALLYTSLTIILFSLIGKLMFLGLFTRRCVNYSDYWEKFAISSNDSSMEIVSWREFAESSGNWFSDAWCLEENKDNLMQCPEEDDYECIPGIGKNPDYGLTNFDSIGGALVQTVRIIDQDYLENILNQITTASSSPTITILYFIVMFFFGTYALGTLAYAILGKHVFDFLENSLEYLPHQNHQDVEISPEQRPRYPLKNDPVLLFVQDVLKSSVWHVTMSSTILLDILALSMKHHNMSSMSSNVSKWLIRFAMGMYTIEFILKLIVDGAKKYFTTGWNLFDISLLVDMYFQLLNRKYSLILFPLRIFKLTPRWNTLHLTFKITVESLKTLWGICGLLITLGAYFSLVGMTEFGQSYLNNMHLFEGGLLPRWSFVDFVHSAMVVFRSWIGESIQVLGECLVLEEQGCIVYFATVALTGVVILMVLTIGVVFVTDKTLKSRIKRPPSILAKMFCYPYVVLKTQRESEVMPTTIYVDKKKIISCSPSPGGSQVLRGVSTFIIAVFSIVLILDDVPSENDIDVKSFSYAIDVVFTVFIFIMSGYSLVVLGIKYCITSPGWLFDIFVVLGMIVNFLYDLRPELNPYPTFCLFICIRPFQLVSRIETLEVVFRGFLNELRVLWKFVLVGVFIWLYFAILGTTMFSGAFSKCLDDEKGSLINSTVVLDRKQCLAMNHTWENSDLNFDHLGKSFISLTLIGKRNSWVSILYDSTDFNAPQMNFRREHELNNFYFFLAFFVCGIFLTANVIFGVLYNHLNKFTGFFLTKDQIKNSEKFEFRKALESWSYTKPDGNYRARVYNFVCSGHFDTGVLCIIILDLCCYAWMDAEMEFWSLDLPIAHQIRIFILFIYVMELVLKLVGWGKSYFYNGWNQFDCLVVLSSVTEMTLIEFGFSGWAIINLLRILRVLRILNFKPFISRAKTLSQYFTALKNFRLAFRNVLIFHCLVMYSYALLGVRKFGHIKFDKGIDEYFSFRTVGSSLRALFMFSSMAGVDSILPALTREENECTPDTIVGGVFHRGDCGNTFWGTVYVFSYSFFSFIAFTNLYVLLILEIIEQLKHNLKQNMRLATENAKSSNAHH